MAVARSAGLRYGASVTRTLIVARDTISSLLEAHASLAAWYYQLSNALRAAGAGVEPPDEPLRLAFVQQLGAHFPELAEVTRSIEHPRPYIPPPAFVPSPSAGAPVPSETAAPAGPPVSNETAAPLAPPTQSSAATPSTPPEGAVPPPLVDPKKVRYE